MAELWSFIQLLVNKWRLEGRTFILGHFLFTFTFDGLFQLSHHSNRHFMVSNDI